MGEPTGFALIFFEGPIVQLVERFICNEELAGSNPAGSTLSALSEESKTMRLEMTMPADSRAHEPQRGYAKAQARDMEGKIHSFQFLVFRLSSENWKLKIK